MGQTPAEAVAAELRRRIAEREERDRAEYEGERATLDGAGEPLGYEGQE